MLLLLLPMRPTKLRFAVDSETSPSAILPPSPAHAPQPGFVTKAPLSMSVASTPERIASSMICFDPGVTISRTRGSILRPSRMRAATARSEEHTSELQSRDKLVCGLLLQKKNEDE